MKSADRIIPSPYFSGSETTAELLPAIGAESLDSLFRSIPVELQQAAHNALAEEAWQGGDEWEVSRWFEETAERNKIWPAQRCWLGGGAYRYPTPTTVAELFKRSEFLTSYTPYQPEISQGTLQGLFEYQSIVARLFGQDLANASLYDGPTAVAEAILTALRSDRKSRRVAISSGLSDTIHSVCDNYLRHVECERVAFVFDRDAGALDTATKADIYVIGYPNHTGVLENLRQLRSDHPEAIIISYTPDPHVLALLEAPGTAGADISVGEGQPFGLPLGFGGPYLGLFACKERFLRQIPGRLAGQTIDRDGKPGFVLTLSTREQHIRREKATSNICSNQGILTLAFSAYAATLGWSGLQRMATVSLQLRHSTEEQIKSAGLGRLLKPGIRFNEFVLEGDLAAVVRDRMMAVGYSFGLPLRRVFSDASEGALLICAPAQTTAADRAEFTTALAAALGGIQ